METHHQAYAPKQMEFPWQVDDTAPFDRAHELGILCSQNALGVADIAAQLRADKGDDICEPYQVLLERGVRVVQTDYHHLLVPCLDAHNETLGYRRPTP